MTKLEKIIEQIKNGQTENITEIDLSFNKIGDDEAIALAEAFKEANLPELEIIHLGHNKIGDNGAVTFANALIEANLPRLEEIDLSSNQIGDNGAEAFAKSLIKANLLHLKQIGLCGNEIGDNGVIELAKALIEAKQRLPRLETIDICGNEIGYYGTIEFAKALIEANLLHLKQIDLSFNKIDYYGAIEFAEALKKANLPRLEEIDLESNQIGDAGVVGFGKALKEASLPHLTRVFLKGNQIGDGGAKTIAEILETCIISNSKYLAKATEKAKQKYQQDWDSTAFQIKQALIDIEYARLLQEEGKLKAAIGLYGVALHGFRHPTKAIPESLDVKQIIKQTTQGMLLAINKLNGEIEELKLPVFVFECFEYLNAKAFEKELLELFADSDVNGFWDPNLAGVKFNMTPSNGKQALFLDIFRKLAAASSEEDSKDESDAYNIIGDAGTASQSEG